MLQLEHLVDFKNTKISLTRPLGSYSKIQTLYSWLIRGKRFQLQYLNLVDKRYLDIGCGPRIQRNFINLDYHWRPGIDLCWDITMGIPLPDESLVGVYSEHCLEHIPFSCCCKVLETCHRILKKHGTLRIVVPDAELFLDLYQKKKLGEKVSFPYEKHDEYKTPMMHVNRIFVDHGHRFAYDAETLTMILKRAGFNNIEKETFMHGRDKNLLIDTEDRTCESLYIEASA